MIQGLEKASRGNPAVDASVLERRANLNEDGDTRPPPPPPPPPHLSARFAHVASSHKNEGRQVSEGEGGSGVAFFTASVFPEEHLHFAHF